MAHRGIARVRTRSTQYWNQLPDGEVGAFLRLFSVLERERNEALEAAPARSAPRTSAQRALALTGPTAARRLGADTGWRRGRGALRRATCDSLDGDMKKSGGDSEFANTRLRSSRRRRVAARAVAGDVARRVAPRGARVPRVRCGRGETRAGPSTAREAGKIASGASSSCGEATAVARHAVDFRRDARPLGVVDAAVPSLLTSAGCFV